MEGEMNKEWALQHFYSEPDEFKRASRVGTTLK